MHNCCKQQHYQKNKQNSFHCKLPRLSLTLPKSNFGTSALLVVVSGSHLTLQQPFSVPDAGNILPEHASFNLHSKPLTSAQVFAAGSSGSMTAFFAHPAKMIAANKNRMPIANFFFIIF